MLSVYTIHLYLDSRVVLSSCGNIYGPNNNQGQQYVETETEVKDCLKAALIQDDEINEKLMTRILRIDPSLLLYLLPHVLQLI
ncbi:hypothetical protein STEG23_030922, partial [Scotinomys teguina]